jgi:hypothetical protein
MCCPLYPKPSCYFSSKINLYFISKIELATTGKLSNRSICTLYPRLSWQLLVSYPINLFFISKTKLTTTGKLSDRLICTLYTRLSSWQFVSCPIDQSVLYIARLSSRLSLYYHPSVCTYVIRSTCFGQLGIFLLHDYLT